MTAFKRALRDDILPLLEEYCYEDFSALQNILGNGLLDLENRRIRQELFEDRQETVLIQALLEPCPEILTSAEALASEESRNEPPTEDSDDGGDGS
jgi:5-methylcytosine-specific restriction protein B